MRKPRPIEIGSSVFWNIKIHPEMEWIGKLDAQVAEIQGEKALIQVKVDATITSDYREFWVPLCDLKNKDWELDLERIAAHEAKRREKAEIVRESEWDGIFYSPEFERYFNSSDDYLEQCEDEEAEPEEYLYCVRVNKSPTLDSTSLVERLSDDFPEEVLDRLKGLDDLDKAIAQFWELNKLETYSIDHSKIILVQSNA